MNISKIEMGWPQGWPATHLGGRGHPCPPLDPPLARGGEGMVHSYRHLLKLNTLEQKVSPGDRIRTT